MSSQVLPKISVAWDEAFRSLPPRASVPTEARLRSLPSPVNGQVGEEQTALDRSANSLVGLLFGVQAHRPSAPPDFLPRIVGFDHFHVVLFQGEPHK